MTLSDRVELLADVVSRLSAQHGRFLENADEVSFDRREGRLDGILRAEQLVLELMADAVHEALGDAL